MVCYGFGLIVSLSLVVFSFLLHFSDSNKSICHCISSLFLRFKNLLYFSLLLLPHSVSFCLANSCTTWFFLGFRVYIYIFYTYMLFIFWIVFSHPWAYFYDNIDSFLYFLLLPEICLCNIFLLCIFPLFCSCLHFPCFPFWIYITTSFWVSSFLLWL